MSRIPIIGLLLATAWGAVAGVDGRTSQQEAAVFASRAELVVLDVVVTDRSGASVGGLPPAAFTVYDEERSQPIQFFNSQDAPATVGLLIDSSASMHPLRGLVISSVEAFARISHPGDEFFALTFNDTVRPALAGDSPFTNDPDVLTRSLRQVFRTHGRTALHDGLAAGVSYLEHGRRARRVLVVVSDGNDNASATPFEEVVHAASAANVVIYAVSPIDRLTAHEGLDHLKELATRTGGTAQKVQEPRAVRGALAQVARDLRWSYSIGYVPPGEGPALRHVRVAVRLPSGEALRARTRTEYLRSPG
jgi:VWFA-related protein